MKLTYYWLVFITLFFGTQAFAEMKHEISVVGVATLYIPVNRLLIDINIKVEGQDSSKVEEQGYQRGIDLKKVFQNYGINEQFIINSDMKLHKIREQIDETKEWQDKYFFVSAIC